MPLNMSASQSCLQTAFASSSIFALDQKAMACIPGQQPQRPSFRPRRLRLAASLTRGPTTPAPDYSGIDANPFNQMLTTLFASRLADELGVPPLPATQGYDAVMQLVRSLTVRANGNGSELTEAAVRVLDSLFPSWLPPAFAVIFSKPLPGFAAWINAVVTVAVTQWLMGPSQVRGEEDGSWTVEVERCRYLEESGCVGTCINSCKNGKCVRLLNLS